MQLKLSLVGAKKRDTRHPAFLVFCCGYIAIVMVKDARVRQCTHQWDESDLMMLGSQVSNRYHAWYIWVHTRNKSRRRTPTGTRQYAVMRDTLDQERCAVKAAEKSRSSARFCSLPSLVSFLLCSAVSSYQERLVGSARASYTRIPLYTLFTISSMPRPSKLKPSKRV